MMILRACENLTATTIRCWSLVTISGRKADGTTQMYLSKISSTTQILHLMICIMTSTQLSLLSSHLLSTPLPTHHHHKPSTLAIRRSDSSSWFARIQHLPSIPTNFKPPRGPSPTPPTPQLPPPHPLALLQHPARSPTPKSPPYHTSSAHLPIARPQIPPPAHRDKWTIHSIHSAHRKRQ